MIFRNEKGKIMKKYFTLIVMMGIFMCFASQVGAEVTNIVKLGSDILIEEEMRVRNACSVGGQITVHGMVERNVIAIGGSIVLARTAVVGGNVISVGGIVVKARDAEVYGNITEINSSSLSTVFSSMLSEEKEGWSWLFAIISLAMFFFILIVALFIVVLAPKPIHIVSDAIRNSTFNVSLWGLLILILIVPLAVLLTISVVGIVLIPLEVLIVLCAALIGFIAVGRLVGNRVLRIFKRPNPNVVWETFWGLTILWFIGWIPYLGWMVKTIAIILGLGSVFATRFGVKRYGEHV
jgi:hypothetical protein